jgi:hypothetical protein
MGDDCMIDVEHAIFLTSRRLARVITGHHKTCGCGECCAIGQLLAVDKGLRLAVQTVCEETHDQRLDLAVVEALTGEPWDNSTNGRDNGHSGVTFKERTGTPHQPQRSRKQ